MRVYKIKYIIKDGFGETVHCERKARGVRMIEAIQDFIDKCPDAFLLSVEFTGEHEIV